MTSEDLSPLDVTELVTRVLDELGADWVLGGSMASSLIGEPRTTMDVDVAVRMQAAHVAQFVARLIDDFYVNADAVADAVRRHSSFNVLHFDTSHKVDVFVLGDGLLDTRQMERRMLIEVERPGGAPRQIWVGSAEDQILRKLLWFRLGGEVSTRQWADVVNILRAQAGRLDLADLRVAALALGVDELLGQAMSDAG
jgi:Nucleotidyl transferase AbiEii toxin, Type IV TA system